MMNFPAAVVAENLDEYLKQALSAPVSITFSENDTVVMLSKLEYERLQALDDHHWGEQAKRASAGGYASSEDMERLLSRRLDETA